MTRQLIVVPHSEWDDEFAVVTWAGSVQRRDFLPALKAALAEWVGSTRAGWDAWQDAHTDLSLDHLPPYLADPDLTRMLSARGIQALTVTLIDLYDHPLTPWYIEDVLLEDDPLNEHQGGG